MSPKVSADFSLCDSNGVCEGIAPEVFEIDDNDYLNILQEEVPADQLDAVRRAVASCPKGALSLAEDGEG